MPRRWEAPGIRLMLQAGGANVPAGPRALSADSEAHKAGTAPHLAVPVGSWHNGEQNPSSSRSRTEKMSKEGKPSPPRTAQQVRPKTMGDRGHLGIGSNEAGEGLEALSCE